VRGYADSVVLIAGGTSGAGLASAVGFAAAGVRRIALLARSPERGEAARQVVLGHCPEAEVLFVPADAGDIGALQQAVTTVHEKFGQIDVAVSSVTGHYRPELLHRTPIEDLATIITQQALPPMLLTRIILPLMAGQGGGAIINVASDAAKVPTPGEAVIGAAMAAIVMFSRTTAVEAKRNGVRVNVLTPSLIANTLTAEMVLQDGFSQKLFAKAASLAHLGVTEPEDLAALIVFLGGPGAAKLTGQAISVNGGISAG
jgi:NAD(P)-dependent dehydrogenase (short-subunit alcohol dehydrogenase family)